MLFREAHVVKFGPRLHNFLGVITTTTQEIVTKPFYPQKNVQEKYGLQGIVDISYLSLLTDQDEFSSRAYQSSIQN